MSPALNDSDTLVALSSAGTFLAVADGNSNIRVYKVADIERSGPSAEGEPARPQDGPRAPPVFADGARFEGEIVIGEATFPASLLLSDVKREEDGQAGTFTALLEWAVASPEHCQLKLKGTWSSREVTMRGIEALKGKPMVPSGFSGTLTRGILSGGWRARREGKSGTFELAAQRSAANAARARQ